MNKTIVLILAIFLFTNASMAFDEKLRKEVDDFLYTRDINLREKLIEKEKDPKIKFFWKYFYATSNLDQKQKEEQLNKLISQEPDAVFPDEGYLDYISKIWAWHTIVPGQKVICTIYFDFAEDYYPAPTNPGGGGELSSGDFQKAEMYYEKVLIVPDRDFLPAQKDWFKNLAYFSLYDLYFNQGKKEKLCEILDEILTNVQNDAYSLPMDHMIDTGRLIPMALLSKACNCSSTEDEKNRILNEVVEKYGDEEWTVTNGGGDYTELAICAGSLEFCQRASKNEKLKQKYGGLLNIRLGDLYLLSGNRSQAQKFFKSASLSFNSLMDVGGGAGVNWPEVEEELKDAAKGDFSEFDHDRRLPGQAFTGNGGEFCIPNTK